MINTYAQQYSVFITLCQSPLQNSFCPAYNQQHQSPPKVRRLHEPKLNTMNENQQIPQIYQIFLCVLRVLHG